jgi:hypothetical protein
VQHGRFHIIGKRTLRAAIEVNLVAKHAKLVTEINKG